MSEPGARIGAHHRDRAIELRDLSRTACNVFDLTYLADLCRIHGDPQAALGRH